MTSVLRTVENVMVPGCLAVYTLSRETALSQYGALKGMAMPVIFFPFSFLATLSTLLLPEITEAHVQNRRAALEHLVNRVMLITLVLSFLAGGLFTQFAKEIGLVLYQSEEIGFYLSILGPLMPFMYMESMVDGILKGLGEQLSSFRYTALDSVVRIALIYLLLPRFGMQGFLFVMLVSNLLTEPAEPAPPAACYRAACAMAALGDKTGVLVFVCGRGVRFVLQPLTQRLGLPLLAWAVLGAVFTSVIYALFIWLTGCAGPGDFIVRRTRKKAGERDSSV